MDNEHEAKIVDAGDLHKYRTEIPNCVDDMDLSVYAFRLYAHMKRVAGDDGQCYQSTRTLAAACKMSAGMVSKAKDELLAAGLIKIETGHDPKKGCDFHTITIVDIWFDNFIKYAPRSPHEQARSHSEQAHSPDEQARSPHETKKNSIKKNPSSGKKSGEPKGKDPTLENDAVKAYRGVMNLTPNPEQRQRISEAVTDMDKWQETLSDWRAHDWSPKNVPGMIERYQGNGKQPSRQDNRQTFPAPTGV